VAGLHAVHFHLEEGAVEVLLPADLGVADTISGTILLHTAGLPGKKREKNQRKLERLGVRVGSLSRPAATTPFGPVAVCARVTGSELPVVLCDGYEEGSEGVSAGGYELSVQLLKPKGRTMLEARIPVSAAPPAAPAAPTYLPLGKAGQPLEIRGVFDGDIRNTRVSLGGHRAAPLAESPRGTVFRSPTSILGRTRLEVVERDLTLTGPFRNLGVMLRFAKPMLESGERTILEIQVHGLEGLEERLPLRIVSLRPESARLERGPSQPLVIHPREVQGGGVYPWAGTIVGVQPSPIQLEVELDGARPRAELTRVETPAP